VLPPKKRPFFSRFLGCFLPQHHESFGRSHRLRQSVFWFGKREVLSVFCCSVLFLFRLAPLAPSCCGFRPFGASVRLWLTLWFLSLLVGWGCLGLGSRPRSGWGERVQRETHEAQAKCGGAAKPRRRTRPEKRKLMTAWLAWFCFRGELRPEDALASVGAGGGLPPTQGAQATHGHPLLGAAFSRF
jgi:hypothetical protein